MKERKAYEKPSERKAREKAEAIRRARKQARKTAIREGLIAAPSPSPASAVARVGPEYRPATDPVRKAEVRSVALGGRALSDVPRACMLFTSTFGRTTGPRRLHGRAHVQTPPPDDRPSACTHSAGRLSCALP
jgi:small subunit ribosomal protein S21